MKKRNKMGPILEITKKISMLINYLRKMNSKKDNNSRGYIEMAII